MSGSAARAQATSEYALTSTASQKRSRGVSVKRPSRSSAAAKATEWTSRLSSPPNASPTSEKTRATSSSERTSHSVTSGESTEAASSRTVGSILSPWSVNATLAVLVNNAGVPGRTRFLDGDPQVIERLVRINYLGGVWCLQAFLPGLRAAEPADVVNIVSVSGVVAGPPSGPYSASKHAQLAFSRTVAAELRGQKIRVHTVKPGFTETEGFPQSWLPRPAKRLVIGPRDVAAHVLRSLEDGRGETTVPWYYGPLAALQDVMPNVFTRVLSRMPQAP